MRRTALLLTLAVAYLAGCGGSGDPTTTERSLSVAAKGVRMQLAPGWHAASENLTPRLVNPREVLSVGTLRMQPAVRGGCAQLPSRAYADMARTDGLITIQERGRGKGSLRGYPPRPAHFQIRAQRRTFECAPPNLSSQEFVFSDAGRRFYAFVVLGTRGPEEEAESILDSFHAARGSTATRPSAPPSHSEVVHRPRVCFTARSLHLYGGEALAWINQQGQGAVGTSLASIAQHSFAPNIRVAVHRLERFGRQDAAQVISAANRGLERVLQDPELLLNANVGQLRRAFSRAQRLAEQNGFSKPNCLY
jgi:hypothetical protein